MFTDVVKNTSKNNASLVVLVEALALIIFVFDAAYNIRFDMIAEIKRVDGDKLNKNLYVLLTQIGLCWFLTLPCFVFCQLML